MAACGVHLELSENEETADRPSVDIVLLKSGNEEPMDRKSVDLQDDEKVEIMPAAEKKVQFEMPVVEKKVQFDEPVVVRKKKKKKKVVSNDVNFWGKKMPMYVAKSIFQYFDTNGTGKLGKEQWYNFLESYGMEQYANEFAGLVDADGCGEISWQEFKRWICKTNYFIDDGSQQAVSKFEILIALSEKFQSYDKDKNGFITIDEFKAVKNEWSYPTDAETFFRIVDKDGNNKITFNEYYHFFFHPYMRKYYPNVFGDTDSCSIGSPGKTLRTQMTSCSKSSSGFL